MSEIIEEIKATTNKKIEHFLNKLGINFRHLNKFLNNPNDYPGNPYNLKLIVDIFLRVSIAENRIQIRNSNLLLNQVYNSVFNQILNKKVKVL